MTLRDDVSRVAEQLRDQARRAWSDVRPGGSHALAELWRPELGATPPAFKRLLEPVVAASALAALGVLVGCGTAALAVLLIAGVLCYLIITYVFGIELGLDLPGHKR